MPLHLPTLNATLNGLAGVFLLLGWLALRRRSIIMHRKCMLLAFSASVFFLGSYLYYHATTHLITRYEGSGFLRVFYFSVLVSHTILAAIVPFASLTALFWAYKRNWQKHTRVTRWLLPIWLYVSFSGVWIYYVLYVV